MIRLALVALLQSASPSSDTLHITMVGNAGVLLTDRTTSLLVDLPYTSGAFGYQAYEPSALRPPGNAVSVITHHHVDHFDAALFNRHPDWRLIGPPSVVRQFAPARVIQGDSVQVGAFSIVVVPTPHTDDHRSYRVRWRGRVLHFVGDTEDATALGAGPVLDVLFITPWLSCATGAPAGLARATRRIGYHLQLAPGERRCGSIEVLPQGARFSLLAR